MPDLEITIARGFFDQAKRMQGDASCEWCISAFNAFASAGGFHETGLNLTELVAIVTKNGGIRKVGLEREHFRGAKITPHQWVRAGGVWEFRTTTVPPGSKPSPS